VRRAVPSICAVLLVSAASLAALRLAAQTGSVTVNGPPVTTTVSDIIGNGYQLGQVSAKRSVVSAVGGPTAEVAVSGFAAVSQRGAATLEPQHDIDGASFFDTRHGLQTSAVMPYDRGAALPGRWTW
jgi:hypothetical protein